jgi:hypothetical protein
MGHHVIGQVVDCVTLKIKLQSFELLGTTYPVTQCHIPEDMNFKKNLSYSYVNLICV